MVEISRLVLFIAIHKKQGNTIRNTRLPIPSPIADLTSLIKSMNYTATTRADGLVSLPGTASNGTRYFVFVRNTTNGAYNATLINGSRYDYSPWAKVTDGSGNAVASTQIDFVLYYILQ